MCPNNVCGINCNNVDAIGGPGALEASVLSGVEHQGGVEPRDAVASPVETAPYDHAPGDSATLPAPAPAPHPTHRLTHRPTHRPTPRRAPRSSETGFRGMRRARRSRGSAVPPTSATFPAAA